MPVKKFTPRRATDFSIVFVLYAIIFFVSLAFLSGSIEGETGFSASQFRISSLLLGLPALSITIVLILSFKRFIGEYKNKTWGYKTRGRVLLYFLLVLGLAAIPPIYYLGSIAIRAVNSPYSKSVSNALDSGMELALFYYSSKENAIQYIAENDILALIHAQGLDSEKILNKLKTKEPELCAVELFLESKSVSFAGEAIAKSNIDLSTLDKNSFLPRLFFSGATYSRYYARYSDFSKDEQNLSVILTIKFNEAMEKAAENLLNTINMTEKKGYVADSFTLYLIEYGLFLIAPLMLIAMLFSIGAAERLTQPMALLSNAIYKVRTGARRVPYLAKPGDESGDLIESLNVLLEFLERSRGDEIHTEKINAWRDIARKLAHELRNPLTPIKLSAERVLRRWKSDPSSVDNLIERSMLAIIQETAAMEALLTEFRDFARLPEPQKSWMELKATVAEVVLLYSQPWPSIKIDYSMVAADIKLKADRAYLKQVLGNLISNAAEACNGVGNILIRADLVKTAESRYCRIQVRDDGPGIPEDVQSKVFSPYFTTKPGGTGLGLSIVEHIVSAHGGSIYLESTPGSGSVFFLDIPAETEN